LRRIDSLRAEYDGIVAAARGSNNDDEHDPEGATIAFEREQLAALLDQARRHLDDIDAAEARVSAGTYGSCERCGNPIGAERLEARPTARTCINCA
jgi:DnaK suppressor protein